MKNSKALPKDQAQTFAACKGIWLESVLSDRHLSQRGKLVASTLHYYHFNYERFLKDGSLLAWPSIRTLAKETGLARNTVRGGIVDLEARGHLKVVGRYDPERRRYTSHQYFAVLSRGVGQDRPVEVVQVDPGVGQLFDPGVGQQVEPDSMKVDSMNKSIPPSLRSGGNSQERKKSGNSGKEGLEEEPLTPSDGLLLGEERAERPPLVFIKRGSLEMRALLSHPAREKYARDGGLFAAAVPADEWGAIWSAFEGKTQ